MSIFGALTALLMIRGIAPTPLNPIFLHYLCCDRDIHSVTKEVLQKWHGSFARRLEAFIGAGSDGNIDQFAWEVSTYADPLNVSSLSFNVFACSYIS